MKILLIHNAYNILGGEDSVVDNEFELLNKHFVVDKLIFENKSGISGLLYFIFSIWNLKSSYLILKKIKQFKPDVIHFHNFHFVIGPHFIRLASKNKISMVMTLHNYRLICPSATLFKDGEIYLESNKSYFSWKTIFNSVYRNSFLLTFWLSFINYFHFKLGTWNLVNRYITLTPFASNLFINSKLKLSPTKFSIKPNFVNRSLISNLSRSESFLFVGRLSEEKGVDLLLNAFRTCDLQLRIAGDGPLASKVLKFSNNCLNISYLGKLSKEDVKYEMQSCSALVFPSIWYEGMPMTIIEAFSLGTPVIANKLGAMESMIEHGINGLHFNQSSFDLVSKLKFWNNLNDFEKDKFSKGAFESYEKNYTPEKNLKMLLSIYESVLDESKKKGN